MGFELVPMQQGVRVQIPVGTNFFLSFITQIEHSKVFKKIKHFLLEKNAYRLQKVPKTDKKSIFGNFRGR